MSQINSWSRILLKPVVPVVVGVFHPYEMMKEDAAGLQVVEVVSDGVWQTQPGHVTPRHPLTAHGTPENNG